MSTLPLKRIVEGWDGFEKLVAELHRTGPVTVEHNVVLLGKSGAPRQIDVVVRQPGGLYEHLVLVECKYWDTNVSRLHVDALATTVNDLNAARGVIFSVKGFQSGAVTAARSLGIDLYKVRELDDREWGLPGKDIDLVLQIVRGSIGNIALPGVSAVRAVGGAARLALDLGDNEKRSRTPITIGGRPAKCDGQAVETLEELIEGSAAKTLGRFNAQTFTINSGDEGTHYMILPVEIAPSEPLVATPPDAVLMVPRVTFDVGVKISQSRLHIDRAKAYVFALALENCITGIVHAASKRNGTDATELTKLEAREPDPGAVVNGSVVKVVMEGYFEFAELADLDPVHRSLPGFPGP